MSLPGLSLPGLSATPSSATPVAGAPAAAAAAASQAPRTETLQPQTEWRFEVAFSQRYTVKLESGNAEMFGVELAPKQTYTFSGYKGAIFTWQGCQLEITGSAESEYAGEETEYAVEWLNVHGMLGARRDQSNGDGPRVLVVGPDFVGKSSLVRSLASWGVRNGHAPTVLNLDPREGLLAPAASLTVVTCDSQMDVDTGLGIGPMSGPTVTPVRIPLIYSFPFASPTEKPEVFKHVTTRMAVSVMSKLEERPAAKRSGLIIDTPGSLNDPKSNYDLISHLVSEFSINLVLTIGSERLFSDLSRRYNASKSPEDPVEVLRIAKPGGAVERDAAFMRLLRAQQIRQYFYGTSKESLHPHSHWIAFNEMDIFRAKSASVEDSSFGPGGDDDDDYDVPYANKPNSSATFERITPTAAMTGGLVAIKFAEGSDSEQAIRGSPVKGFLSVAEVDETKKRVRFLSPHPQRWGKKALVWGHGWPEVVADLTS
ncbi:mRNA cleavage and polyadenylation factor CLP1 [Lecanosticta acicola]|uniref:Polynucleotide 5'-hydroxyl-kinase GRC3 n=1 Tax=Lecanosticta acicola TaxID=111012 RepID=A0AAI8Z792_9PEZI|nr:mRNA cleavage and polyadenylation factor CLP1 [Lecanosticta acicola]